MREIKFRAWHNYGDDGSGKMLFVGDSSGTTHPLDCCMYALQGQDVVLMQYTGLKDKNGTEIYEGDIVVLDLHPGAWRDKDGPAPIEWIDDGWDWLGFGQIATALGSEFGSPEVIGNIHANPELMEQSE